MKDSGAFPLIPDEEFQTRMEAFRSKMAEHELDLVVAFSNLLDPSAVRYFSDVSPINESAALLISREGEPVLCSGQACHEWSRHKSKVRDIRIMPEVGEVSGVEYEIEGQLDFEDLFREFRDRYTIKRIGIIGDLIFPYEIYRKLERVFSDSEKTSAEMLMYELRMRKSENEIACIRKACEIVSESFSYAVGKLKPGMTELDIQADIEGQMLRLGAEAYGNSFAPMIPSGTERSNLCMNRNTLRKISEGEIIDLQAPVLYEGYNGVICSPVVLGTVPREVAEAVQIAYEAMRVVEEKMKPGAVSPDLYRVYSDFLERKGYREFSPYGSVHSLGMLECETPFFSANREVPLLENMVVAVDVYFKGLSWGSFRLEDTFVIGSGGAQLLTTFNRDFIPGRFA
jgi:Xaa-Pro aminopeptidase